MLILLMIIFLVEIVVNKQCFLFTALLAYQRCFSCIYPMPLDFVNMWFTKTFDFATIISPSVEFVDYCAE